MATATCSAGMVRPVMSIESIVTNDVDEARLSMERLFYEHTMELVRDRHAFDFGLTATRSGPMTAALLHYRGEVLVGGIHPDTSYSVTVPFGCSIRVEDGPTETVVDSATAAILQPHDELRIHGVADGLLLKFERDALETELRQMLGRDVNAPIRFGRVFNLAYGPGMPWWQIAQVVVSGLDIVDGIALNPLLASRLTSTLMSGLLLAADHAERDALVAPPPSMRPQAIQRAVRIIEDRAHEPLTVPAIAEEAGCSVRALQAGFRRHMDTTPHGYLERVRMDRVHTELRLGTPETATVARVASRWGFGHLGRFAAAYRALYGVPPSATLRD